MRFLSIPRIGSMIQMNKNINFLNLCKILCNIFAIYSDILCVLYIVVTKDTESSVNFKKWYSYRTYSYLCNIENKQGFRVED